MNDQPVPSNREHRIIWCLIGPNTEEERTLLDASIEAATGRRGEVVYLRPRDVHGLESALDNTRAGDYVATVDCRAYSGPDQVELLVHDVQRETTSGAVGVAWTAGASDPADLAGKLLAHDVWPSLAAPAESWKDAFLGGAKTPQEVFLSTMALLPQIVVIQPAAQVGPQITQAQSLPRDHFSPLSVAQATREALLLDAAGAPGWSGNAEAVLDVLLRATVRDATMDKAPIVESLVEMSAYLNSGALNISVRTREILTTAKTQDVETLTDLLNLRVVVAGHDLKFIEFALDYLPEGIEIRKDQWQGEKRHDEAVSRELVEWADVIWVEWLAYCAAWYSEKKRVDQVLIIRQHRYELLRDAADAIDYTRVDAVVAIAVHTMEAVHERFGVPRSKLRVIPNIYEADRYEPADALDEDRQFRLALVGSTPRLKGLHRALEVLSSLRESDERYTLTIFGRRPEELPWVIAKPEEAAYFEACARYISDERLGHVVSYAGWVDLRKELRNYGYVLSTSDLEGSHVSPGEAFLVGNVGVLLRWRGVEYVYPREFTFQSPREMAAYINGKPLFSADTQASIAATAQHLAGEQGVHSFLTSVHRIVRDALL